MTIHLSIYRGHIFTGTEIKQQMVLVHVLAPLVLDTS